MQKIVLFFWYFWTKPILLLCMSFCIFPTFAANTYETIEVWQEPSAWILQGTKLYVMNAGDNSVSVIDTAKNSVIKTIKVGVRPTFALAVGGKLYVSNSWEDTVSVINLSTDSLLEHITVWSHPRHSTLSGTKLFVSNSNGKGVSVIDTNTRKVITTADTGWSVDGHPYVSLVANSKIFVVNKTNNDVAVINLTNYGLIKSIGVSGWPVSGTFIASKWYVNNSESNNVSVINTSNNTLMSSIIVETGPISSTLVGTKLYVNNSKGNSLSVIDTITNTVTRTIPVWLFPISSTLVGTKLYVNNSKGNSVSVIDTITNTVIDTLPVEPGPVWSILRGNRIYVYSWQWKYISVLYMEKPSLYLMTSTSPSGNYDPGKTVDVRAIFDQPLQEWSVMTVKLNTWVSLKLSGVDKNMLYGTYTVGDEKSVADLSVESLSEIKIIGISGFEGTNYVIPKWWNLWDMRNIVITAGIAPITPLVCQNSWNYRICPTTRPAGNIGEHQDALLCEGIISEAQTKRSYKRITRGDVLGIAVNMLRVPEAEVADYSGSFEDITEPMQPMIQIALDRGLITSTRLFEPQRLVTRLEAYTLLMKGVCLNPVPVEGQNWTQAVYQTAYKAGVTNKTLSRFKPSATITKKEAFIIASQLADWADTTGGCRPQVCK